MSNHLFFLSPTSIAVMRIGCLNMSGMGSAWKQSHLLNNLGSLELIVATITE